MAPPPTSHKNRLIIRFEVKQNQMICTKERARKNIKKFIIENANISEVTASGSRFVVFRSTDVAVAGQVLDRQS